LATNKYNNTIHSFTHEKPVQIVHSKSADFKMRISQKIQKAQKKTLDYVNKDRTNRDYLASEKVFLKANKRLGNKLSPLFLEKIIEADLGTTVQIEGRVVHKDNLR